MSGPLFLRILAGAETCPPGLLLAAEVMYSGNDVYRLDGRTADGSISLNFLSREGAAEFLDVALTTHHSLHLMRVGGGLALPPLPTSSFGALLSYLLILRDSR